MSLKSFISKIYAKHVFIQTQLWANNPVATQQKVFNDLIRQANATQFGKDHLFSEINSFSDFQKQVPIRDYEALRPYIDKVVAGEKDILWTGKLFISEK